MKTVLKLSAFYFLFESVDKFSLLLAVLRIHEIWVRIRIRESIRYLWRMDPVPDQDPAVFVSDLQDFTYFFLKEHWLNF